MFVGVLVLSKLACLRKADDANDVIDGRQIKDQHEIILKTFDSLFLKQDLFYFSKKSM